MEKIDIAGLKISAIRKQELLELITERVSKREKTFVVTPYSEFLYASMRNPEKRALLNSADFAIADGIGILWADLFLSIPLTLGNFYLNILQAWWQVVWTGASILLLPSLLYRRIPEKIVGADLIWDLAAVAEKNDFKVYLLGARGDITGLAAKKLQAKFPNLKIVGASNKDMSDPSILEDINSAHPDMLFVAFKAQVAEQWIADNLSKTTAAFAIALGGTFDYIAGAKKQPPKFVRTIGLEWLYRLITQPSRLGRIYRGVVGLIIALMRYKVFATTPFRSNVVAVVINKNGKILICKHTTWPTKFSDVNMRAKPYWEFPQGGVEEGEDIIEAAKRELFEETGIKDARVIAQSDYKLAYVWDNATRPLFVKDRWINKGQEQTTVFFEFTGNDDEIILDNREFDDYQWLTPQEVLQLIASVRRPHAEKVLAELAQIHVN